MKETKADTNKSFTHERPETITKLSTLGNNIDCAKLYGVFSNSDQLGFRITWEGDKGFGQLDFYRDWEDGKISINTEMMSKEFVVAVLTKLVDDATI